jgi:hypothetical protein
VEQRDNTVGERGPENQKPKASIPHNRPGMPGSNSNGAITSDRDREGTSLSQSSHASESESLIVPRRKVPQVEQRDNTDRERGLHSNPHSKINFVASQSEPASASSVKRKTKLRKASRDFEKEINELSSQLPFAGTQI